MRNRRVMAEHHAGMPQTCQVRKGIREAGQRMWEHPRLRIFCVIHILLFFSREYLLLLFKNLELNSFTRF